MTYQELNKIVIAGQIASAADFATTALAPFCPPAMVLPQDLKLSDADMRGYKLSDNILKCLGLPANTPAYKATVINDKFRRRYNFYLLPVGGQCMVLMVFDPKVSNVISYLKYPDRSDMKRGFVKRSLKKTYTFYTTPANAEGKPYAVDIDGALALVCPVEANMETSIEGAILPKAVYVFSHVSYELLSTGWKVAMQTENMLLDGKSKMTADMVKYFHLKFMSNFVINPSEPTAMKRLNAEMIDKLFENTRYVLDQKIDCYPEPIVVRQYFDLCADDEYLDSLDVVHCYYIIHTPIGRKQWRCKLEYKGIKDLLAETDSLTFDSRMPLLSKACRNHADGLYDSASVALRGDTLYVRCDYPDTFVGEREDKMIEDMKRFIFNILIEISKLKVYKDLEQDRKSNQEFDYTRRMIWMHYLFNLLPN